MKTKKNYGVPCVGDFFESFERKAKGEAKPCWKTDQKSKHKALQRDIGKCFKSQSKSIIIGPKSLLGGLLGTPGGRKATDESTKRAKNRRNDAK